MRPRDRSLPRSTPAVALVVAVLALAGCQGGSEREPALDGATEITIGTLPIIDVAPIHLAIEEGLFAAEGLSVSVEVVAGGAAAIPALVSGDLDIAYGAWPSFLLANAQGFELRAVADGTAARPGFTELLAMPDSGLEGRPEALGGKRIAVNTLGNLGELAVRSTLARAGLDPDDVVLVEIGFPEMTAALERGDVDVIWASEPVATLARDRVGAVLVADSYVGDMEGFPVAGYQASAEFVEANPHAVAAFRRALDAAVDRIRADQGLVADIAPSFTNLDPELAEVIALPEFRSTLDAATLQQVHNYLRDFGLLGADLDVPSLLADAG